MASTTIRISQRAREEARELARVTGKPMAVAVEEAINRERRRLFFDAYRRAAEEVRSNPEVAAKEEWELAPWDATLLDGLQDEPIPE